MFSSASRIKTEIMLFKRRLKESLLTTFVLLLTHFTARFMFWLPIHTAAELFSVFLSIAVKRKL